MQEYSCMCVYVCVCVCAYVCVLVSVFFVSMCLIVSIARWKAEKNITIFIKCGILHFEIHTSKLKTKTFILENIKIKTKNDHAKGAGESYFLTIRYYLKYDILAIIICKQVFSSFFKMKNL